MGTIADAVTSTFSKIVAQQSQYRTHQMQTAAVVGLKVNLRMVTTVVTSTTQSISAGVLLDLSHNSEHLVFLKTNHDVSLLEKGWFHSHGILRMGSPKGVKPRDS